MKDSCVTGVLLLVRRKRFSGFGQKSEARMRVSILDLSDLDYFWTINN